MIRRRQSIIRRVYKTSLLFRAVRESNLSLVRLLLKEGASVKIRDKCSRSVLHINAANGSCKIARLLLKAGCKVNAIDCIGNTALNEAIRNKNINLARCLLKAGGSVHVKNRNGNTALHLAVTYLKSADFIKSLLDHGANVNAVNPWNEGALHFAIECRSTDIVKLLLSRGAKVDALAGRVSPLHTAAGISSVEIAKLLLAAGADPNHRDANDCLPIQCAVYTHNLKVVEMLAAAGSNLNSQNKIGATTLHNAVMSGNVEIVSFVLKQPNVNLSAQTNDGDTPLHWATMLNFGESHEKIIRLLLDKGAKLNERNSKSQIPFHFVAQQANLRMAKMLLDYGANLTVRDLYGSSPLHYAVCNPDWQVLKLVMDCGLDVNERCVTGVVALHCAAKQCKSDHVKMLLEKGADPNAKDNFGNNSLYYSIIENNPYNHLPKLHAERKRTVRLLLDYGADVNNTFVQNWPILEIAIRRRDDTVIRVIVEYMARLEFYKPQLSERNAMLILSNDIIREHYERCITELTMLKSRIVFGRVSFFNILTDDVHKVTCYARNNELYEAFRSSDYKLVYPIYRRRLRSKFYEGVKRQQFTEQAALKLNNIMGFVDPRHLVYDKILRYLKLEDLQAISEI